MFCRLLRYCLGEQRFGGALLAGVSMMAGQAVILLVNRVTGWRFAVGLLLSAIWLVVLHAIESVVLWGLGRALIRGGQRLDRRFIGRH